ncbi:unnamed protein product [Clavelina lepadiformis]|uniref:Aldehyde dehydrogenase n=1 Tax=Clavelina lepadiformis TaxID=159417 RepID=A0ABP0G1G2_CLALP
MEMSSFIVNSSSLGAPVCNEKCLKENEQEFCNALEKDLHRPKLEAVLAEIIITSNEIVYALENIDSWAKDETCSTNILNKFTKTCIRKEPYGVCLIMSAWNYPLVLLLAPLVAAIAAGNCAVIKPSECAKNCAAALQSILPKYLDNDCYPVMVLNAEQSAKLTKYHRFDFIFFTGGTSVGRYVMKAAAEHLTPVVLELGGKNPCYVDSTCNLRVAARRIVWGRYYNAGQICLAPDYIMINESIREKFLVEVKAALKEFYGENPKASSDYGRIINKRQFGRLKQLLKSGSGKIVIGGEMDEKENYIAPTVVVDVDVKSPFMQEEMFGPIMLILTIPSLEEAIAIINAKEKPLALYMFSKDKPAINRMLNSTVSGGVTVNDVFAHYIPHNLPFGGVGNSGMGSYHGKFGFDAFTHKRSCVVDGTPDALFSSRYPPYTDTKLSIIRLAFQKSLKSGGPFKKISSFLWLTVLGVVLAYLFRYLELYYR